MQGLQETQQKLTSRRNSELTCSGWGKGSDFSCGTKDCVAQTAQDEDQEGLSGGGAVGVDDPTELALVRNKTSKNGPVIFKLFFSPHP